MHRRLLWTVTALALLASCAPPPRYAATPSSVLNLDNWILTIPEENGEGESSEIDPDRLRTYSSSYFRLNDSRDRVFFQATAGGYVQDGSLFPRTELREMMPRDRGQEESNRAFWRNNSGTHRMMIRQAITRLPEVHPSIVAGQLHDVDNYVALIRLDGKHLYVKSNGKNVGTLDKNYELGAFFVVEIMVTKGLVEVSYNGELKVSLRYDCEGCYFKAGAYLQTNDSLDYGDKPGAVGEVAIATLRVIHE